jgi:predicted DNA-binding protein
MAGKDNVLQARVASDFAERLALIAKTQGKSTSQLIRDAIEDVVTAAENDRNKLSEQLRQPHRDEERKLGLLDEEPADTQGQNEFQ